MNACRMFAPLPLLTICAVAFAQAPKDDAGRELYRKLLATPVNPAYPTRAAVSDPSTWRPVKFQAVAPTGGVTLDDGGVFKPVMANNIAYLLETCPVDSMLYYFRLRAGRQPSPADKPQCSWWEDDLRGSYAGRFLLGAGNTLRWVEHPELRKRMNELVDGIAACREANGYILAFPPDSMRHGEEVNYARTDFTQGLIEAAVAGNPKIYPLLRGHADWFNQWELLPKLAYIDNGYQGHVASTRTYFTPVGKPEDLQAAEKGYVMDHWMEQLAARDPEAIWKFFNRPHAFLIQGLEGYLDHYIAKGDKKFLDAAMGAWDLYHDDWEHIGGSIAICEFDPYYPPKSYYITAKGHTGELCGCVVWLKFNQRFHQLYPMEEKYMGEIEKTIYNVGLANQEVGKLGIRYHALLEGNKCKLETTNTCCEVQGARLYGSLPEYVYSIAEDGLYVNLYEPSTIKWQAGGKPVGLTMSSKFPFQPQVALKLATAEPVAMKLRVRVPGWATADMPITVNGQPAVTGKPGSYVVLDRTWSDGDVVSFTLPMDFRVTRYRGADQIAGHQRYALEYGPILLAAVGPLGKDIPVQIAHDPARPHDWLKPKADQPLHFDIDGDAGHVVMPYWQVADQTYTCFTVMDAPDGRLASERKPAELQSSFFAFHLDTRAGLRAVKWENRLTGRSIALGEGSELEVDLGELNGPLETPQWQVSKRPEKPTVGEAEGEAVFELSSKEPALAARVTYRWDGKEPVLRKFVRITNSGDRPVRLLNVRLGTYQTDAKIADREQGFPLYLNDELFMSLAHPAGWATGKDKKISLRQYPGAKLAPGATFDCMETVYGVGTAGAARKTFVAHVRNRTRRVVRGHDKPYAIFDNFGSWPSGAGGDWRNSEEIEMHSLKLLAESQKVAGVHFDFCNIHFWVDPAGDLKRWEPQRFPNGIKKIKELLDSIGTKPGLWIDSSMTWSGGWGIGQNPDAKASISDNPGWYCRASEPIKSIYREGFLWEIRNNGIREMKFDNLHTVCNNPRHDHLPGLYSTEAIENSIIEFLHDLDKECPGAFLILYWGHRSPWWLLHGDTVFDSGLGIEAASPSSQPSIWARDSVTQKLDQAQWHASDVPALGKDSLGVWLSDWAWNSSIGKARWQEGVVMDMCRGSMLLQIWADNDWLSPPEWTQLADFLALLRAAPKCFGNPRFILGNPQKDEPYGYCCTDGQRAFLAIDNCTWEDRTLPLTLDAMWGLPDGQRWDLYRWYPRPARLKGEGDAFGPKAAITLRPFEVVLLEAVPAGKRPSVDHALPTEAIPSGFGESSRSLEVAVHDGNQKEDPTAWTVLTTTSAVSAGGAILSRQIDDSILASGKNPSPDTYTVTADTMVAGITGIRLEVLDDPSLPSHGPGRAYNGNFALAEFSVTAAAKGNAAEARPAKLHKPAASFSQGTFGGWPVAAAIDGDPKTAWSVDPREGESQTAVFETAGPVGTAGGMTLTFMLTQGYVGGPADHTIGKFRLSVTTAKPPIPPPPAKDSQRFVARATVPASAHGGTLVIAAELKKGVEPAYFGDIGSHFSAEAKLAGQAATCVPVMGAATYPSCWQGWRMKVEASDKPREVELAVTASLPGGLQYAFTGHFVPD